jgi:osmotically-inducible protein OsmY
MRGIFCLTLIAALTPALNGCAAPATGGKATNAAAADKKRGLGVYLDDEEIELHGLNRMHELFPQASVSVSVTSFNHNVLLTGQAPDEATRAKIEETIKSISKVGTVYNQITIAGVESVASEVRDSAITANVKTRLLTGSGVNFIHVKVVTEGGVVYLMGLLSHSEADAATQTAATTAGVLKVVKLIEYTD